MLALGKHVRGDSVGVTPPEQAPSELTVSSLGVGQVA